MQGAATIDTSMKMITHNNEQLQLFMRAVTNGSLSERDRLLEYSVGSFYNELHLFILQNKKREAKAK